MTTSLLKILNNLGNFISQQNPYYNSIRSSNAPRTQNRCHHLPRRRLSRQPSCPRQFQLNNGRSRPDEQHRYLPSLDLHAPTSTLILGANWLDIWAIQLPCLLLRNPNWTDLRRERASFLDVVWFDSRRLDVRVDGLLYTVLAFHRRYRYPRWNGNVVHFHRSCC